MNSIQTIFFGYSCDASCSILHIPGPYFVVIFSNCPINISLPNRGSKLLIRSHGCVVYIMFLPWFSKSSTSCCLLSVPLSIYFNPFEPMCIDVYTIINQASASDWRLVWLFWSPYFTYDSQSSDCLFICCCFLQLTQSYSPMLILIDSHKIPAQVI